MWGTSHDVLLLELLICAEAKRADLEPSHTADVLWALGRANFRSAPSTHLIQLLVLPIWPAKHMFQYLRYQSPPRRRPLD